MGEVPSEEAVEAFQDAVARAKRKVIANEANLLTNDASRLRVICIELTI